MAEEFPNKAFWQEVCNVLAEQFGLCTYTGDGVPDPATIRMLALHVYDAAVGEGIIVGWGPAYAADRVHKHLGLR
jgi:hypothetical protein